MDPKAPSQPGLETSYNTAGNPINHSQQEAREANAKVQGDTTNIDKRGSGDLPVQSQDYEAATQTSMAQGVRDSSGDKGEAMGPPASNTEGEQMRAPGEGDVSRKQLHKDGFGEQSDMASDLGRKKQEQAGAREEIKAQRQEGVNVGGALGDRLGPAGSQIDSGR